MINLLPTGFVEQMKKLLPTDFEQFFTVLDTPPPVSIRYNPRKISFENLEHMPIKSQVPWHPYGYYLESRPSFTFDPFFHAGAYYVQEASSMFLHEVLKQTTPSDKPLRILDLCAAPGGKTTLIASWMPEGSLLIANEVIRSRVTTLKQNLLKWGNINVFTSNYDPETFLPLTGWFDVVVVDAPCSGEGLFRKNNQARQEWTTENIELCSARQRRILRIAQQLVATGGTLIYSTCTYNSSENEMNAKLLSAEDDLPTLPLKRYENWNIRSRQPGYQFYPHLVEGEGFYINAFRKAGRVRSNLKHKKEFYKLSYLNNKEKKAIAPWFAEPDNYSYLKDSEGNVYFFPKEHGSDLLILDYHLPVGVWLHDAGQLKGDKFIPAHTLAMVPSLTHVNSVELEESDALLYLKKELNQLPVHAPSGWLTANYKGVPLGWIRNMGSRFNNYYPSTLRILKEIKK